MEKLFIAIIILMGLKSEVCAQASASAFATATIVSLDELTNITLDKRTSAEAGSASIKLDVQNIMPGQHKKVTEIAAFTILNSQSTYAVTLQDEALVLNNMDNSGSISAALFRIVSEQKGKEWNRIAVGASFSSNGNARNDEYRSNSPYVITINFN